jgi:undecaprenyl-phosphate 4-deoxy-4-formamido-L-arabinose transferase
MSIGRTYPFGISVVIPVYNGERTLTELISRLEKALSAISAHYEVVLVNDGSRDYSWDVIQELAGKHSWVRGINLMRNYGQHNALLCGIREATHEVIVTMDDDLQHPPEEIPKLLDKLSEGYDVVYGSPEKERHDFWRNIASRVTKLALQTVMGAKIARNVSAFRVLRAEVCNAFANYQSPFVSIDVLLAWGASNFGSVQVNHEFRREGVSNYTFRRLVTHAVNMVTGFSVFPLQVASLLGFGLTLFGSGLLLYVVGLYLIQGGSVPGFSFLASIICIFSGAQLFSLGIIGEYIARMHFRMMGRPPYTVRSRTSRS